MTLVAIEISDDQQLQREAKGECTYTRSWKVTSTYAGPSLYEVQAACDVAVGDDGPQGTKCSAVRIQGTESRYLYKVQAEYSKPEGTQNNPLDEPDEFSWSFSGTQEPALFALTSPTARTRTKPIVNSAKDPLENVTIDVAEVRLHASGNRATFPPSKAIQYVNCVNSDEYAGGAPGTWKVMGIEAASATAEIEDPETGSTTTLDYWKITTDLAYRADGWKLKLLNVGYNELHATDGKVKISLPRATDEDAKARAWFRAEYAAADPQALNEDGTAKNPGEPPDTLEFDIYTAVPFSGVFSEPPSE
jgi:hypothetical protein